jgi:endonuclease/exonuclease/phosphatase (EEP) superfamily protein YafD
MGLTYLAILGLIAWGNSEGPELAWWRTLNLYLPQYFWAVPAVILLPIYGWIARKWIWIPLAALIWVAGPMMGFHWNSPQAAPAGARARLRVMTYNIAGQPDHPLVVAEIESAHADLIFLQECPYIPKVLKENWFVAGPFGGNLVASRTPLTEVEDRQLRLAPDWRRYARCKTNVRGVPITLYGMHLDTPREGLQTLRERKLRGISAFEEDISTRLFRAAAVAESLRQEAGPLILAGDLNAPEPSLICRTLERTGLRDAFSEAGRGYGYSYGHSLRMGISYVRIDHIMVGNPFKAEACRTGGAEGSDHRPVIADLFVVK